MAKAQAVENIFLDLWGVVKNGFWSFLLIVGILLVILLIVLGAHAFLDLIVFAANGVITLAANIKRAIAA